MATFEPVTDPNLLAQLNAPAAPVDSDPYSTAEGGVPVTPNQLTVRMSV